MEVATTMEERLALIRKIAKRKGPKIRVRMKMSKPKIDDGNLDGKSVARKIRARKLRFSSHT